MRNRFSIGSSFFSGEALVRGVPPPAQDRGLPVFNREIISQQFVKDKQKIIFVYYKKNCGLGEVFIGFSTKRGFCGRPLASAEGMWYNTPPA
jgi:hypothetical protein